MEFGAGSRASGALKMASGDFVLRLVEGIGCPAPALECWWCPNLEFLSVRLPGSLVERPRVGVYRDAWTMPAFPR